jgi:hypothetical protein
VGSGSPDDTTARRFARISRWTAWLMTLLLIAVIVYAVVVPLLTFIQRLSGRPYVGGNGGSP